MKTEKQKVNLRINDPSVSFYLILTAMRNGNARQTVVAKTPPKNPKIAMTSGFSTGTRNANSVIPTEKRT